MTYVALLAVPLVLAVLVGVVMHRRDQRARESCVDRPGCDDQFAEWRDQSNRRGPR